MYKPKAEFLICGDTDYFIGGGEKKLIINNI